MERLHAFTESQRPARRLTRKQSDPFAPKWSLPMMASNFPGYWNTIAPPPKPQTVAVSTPGGGGTHRASLSEEWGEDEVVPPGYNWLQRKTRDGQTVFPYSLASHKAFFEWSAQCDPPCRVSRGTFFSKNMKDLEQAEWRQVRAALETQQVCKRVSMRPALVCACLKRSPRFGARAQLPICATVPALLPCHSRFLNACVVEMSYTLTSWSSCFCCKLAVLVLLLLLVSCHRRHRRRCGACGARSGCRRIRSRRWGRK
ncbi:unnamed protein product [Symbiodinium sp. CCMP2456]|nr:unnamed protein product [Symbiodinium sp. CCMP2456]